MSSSWLRLLVEPSDKLELAELNGCSDGHGDGGPPERNVVVHPIPDRRRGLYLGGPRNGTVNCLASRFFFFFVKSSFLCKVFFFFIFC